MDLARLFALAGLFLSTMLGGLYATTQAEGPSVPSVLLRGPEDPNEAGVALPPGPEASEDAVVSALPSGRDVPIAPAEPEASVIVDAATGVTIGPLKLSLAEPLEDPEEADAASARGGVPRRTVPRRVVPRPPSGPRLDPDPGRHVLLTARGMMARGETVRGSCYAYLSEVFDRAGHDGWRTRSIVHQAGSSGPYADLDLIRPGDWLYIVNNPDSTPVGTHSVLFVGWEDRANGYARTISHAGWAAGDSPGREGTYDVTRTYRIIRPRLAQ